LPMILEWFSSEISGFRLGH